MRISDWSSDVCSSDLGTKSRLGVDDQRNNVCVLCSAPGSLHHGAVRATTRFEYARRVNEHDLRLTFQGDAQQARARCLCLGRSEEHTSELQSLMRISYAVFCLKKKK